MLLVHLFAFAGDLCGSYLVLRFTRRWWLLVPAAIAIGILSGALSALLVYAAENPGKAFATMIQAAGLHAVVTVPGIFWLRWWLSPMK